MKTPKFSIISITKWNEYQSTNSLANNQSTGNQQATNRQLTALEEGKKGRREEGNNKANPKNANDVEEYALSIDYHVDGQSFIDYYEANGWMRGKSKIKCWKACLRTWKKNNNENKPTPNGSRINASTFKDKPSEDISW